MSCFSQDIYPKKINDSLIVITNTQLKKTNLIFLEHKKIKLENIELNKQINYYTEYVRLSNINDSISNKRYVFLKLEYDSLSDINVKNKNTIQNLKFQNKIFKIGTCGFVITIAALILFK